jgi:hypothetical protein
MIAAALPELKEESRRFWREAKELHLIFATIHKKASSRSREPDRTQPR